MASQIYLNAWYLVPRLVMWAALFGVAAQDGWKHRNVASRSWRLYAGVVLVLFFFVIQDTLLLVFAVTDPTTSGGIFRVYIFFTDVADSLFIALLLTVAAGYCITRDTLAPYTNKVVWIPTVYCITILVVDYIIDGVRGREAFDIADYDNPQQNIDVHLSDLQRLLLIVCAVANLVALLLAWVNIFDTISKEREMLEMPEQDVYARPQEGNHLAHPQASAAAAPATTEAGHAVMPPPDIAINDPEIALPNIYGNITGEDLDGPKTVEERVTKNEKVRILKHFSWGVAGYVIATAVVLLLPAFVTNQPGEEAVRVVLICQNVVLWAFMASLAWIFRLRGDSPYLLLDEEGADTSQHPDHALTTELGVLTADELADPEAPDGYAEPPLPRPPPPAPKPVTNGAHGQQGGSSRAPDSSFALEDDEQYGQVDHDVEAEKDDQKMLQGIEKSA